MSPTIPPSPRRTDALILAAAFHIFGVHLLSLRLCVFAFFLLWIPAVYSIARRFLSPLWGGIACVARRTQPPTSDFHPIHPAF